jgi:hypothetical protein
MVMPSFSLYHWSQTPIEALDQRQYVQDVDHKPKGFWFDSDGDWARWCEGEEYGLQRLEFKHRIDIADWSRILLVETVSQLDLFAKMYFADRWHIDWKRVAANFSGILISPYQWERRLHPLTSWYYSWDCASGCVWDVGAIKLCPAIKEKAA